MLLRKVCMSWLIDKLGKGYVKFKKHMPVQKNCERLFISLLKNLEGDCHFC